MRCARFKLNKIKHKNYANRDRTKHVLIHLAPLFKLIPDAINRASIDAFIYDAASADHTHKIC